MAITPISSIPYPAAAPAAQADKKAAATPSGTPTNTFSDSVTLSPQAQSFVANGQLLTVAGGRRRPSEGIDVAQIEKAIEHMHTFGAFAREAFGLGSIEEGGGMMLTGEISNVIKKAMANAGILEPEKPADATAASQPAPGAGSQDTSLVTLHLPESKGGGSVELWFDSKGLDKLAGLSADELKDGLLDLMKGGAQADAVNASIDKSVFGRFMDENAAYHPEYKKPAARLAYVDPDAPAGSSPLFMIQSKDRPDYVSGQADEMFKSVLNLLKAAKA